MIDSFVLPLTNTTWDKTLSINSIASGCREGLMQPATEWLGLETLSPHPQPSGNVWIFLANHQAAVCCIGVVELPHRSHPTTHTERVTHTASIINLIFKSNLSSTYYSPNTLKILIGIGVFVNSLLSKGSVWYRTFAQLSRPAHWQSPNNIINMGNKIIIQQQQGQAQPMP